MEDMRRIDVWIGRAVAVAGVVYVVLASVWPFAADAAEAVDSADGSATVFTVPSSAGAPARTGDLGLARVVADVATRRERRAAAASPDDGGLEESARVARGIAVLPPWSIASDIRRDSEAPDVPPPSFAVIAVGAAIALSACALRDQRRTVAALDLP